MGGAFNFPQLSKANLRRNVQHPAPLIARVLKIRGRNDHFRKTIPKAEEFMFLPKTYLPGVRSRAQGQERKNIRKQMKPRVEQNAITRPAPDVFSRCANTSGLLVYTD